MYVTLCKVTERRLVVQEDEAGTLQSLVGRAKGFCFYSKKNEKPTRDLQQWSHAL